MKPVCILDTGPLVALLSERDHYHSWAKECWERVPPPLLTCEPVLTEACFLLAGRPGGREGVFNLLRRGAVQIAFPLATEIDAVDKLMRRYRDVPMSLADACLVRLAERNAGSSVLTLDTKHFGIYRIHGRQVIPMIRPLAADSAGPVLRRPR